MVLDGGRGCWGTGGAAAANRLDTTGVDPFRRDAYCVQVAVFVYLCVHVEAATCQSSRHHGHHHKLR